jgi:hypothetical protein
VAERYFKVGPRLWADTRGWTQDQRELWVYLLTCPHRRTEGLYLLPKGYIMGDLGWSPERLEEPLAELVAKGFIDYDEEASVVLVCKALKWQAPANPNGVKAAIKQVEELPETRLLTDFYVAAQRYCERLAKGLAERFPERLAEPLGEPQAPTQAPTPTHTPAGAPEGAAADLCVGKMKVTDWEQDLGREIIGVFNELAGTSLTFEANFEKLVERIRQKPDLSGADHRRILEANFKNPWWSDTPGIGVVYGSAKAFEQAIDKAAHGERKAEKASKYDKGMEVVQL